MGFVKIAGEYINMNLVTEIYYSEVLDETVFCFVGAGEFIVDGNIMEKVSEFLEQLS